MTVHTNQKAEMPLLGVLPPENEYIHPENAYPKTENAYLATENAYIATENAYIAKMDIKCPTCYKVFTRQCGLIEHKDKCTGRSHPFECQKCNAILSNSSSLSRHKKTCTGETTSLIIVDTLRAENEKLKQQIQLYEAKSGCTNNTNVKNTQHINSHNQQNTNNVTININGLGKEDTSYLTKKFMTKCIKNKLKGVMDYLESKHFHVRHPENHNLKKLTKKDSFMECFDGKKWNTQYCDDILRDVFNNMQAAFGDFVETTMKDGNLKKVWLDNFMSTVGSPLEWDFTCDDYDYNDRMTDEQRSRLKERVFSLAIEHIYKNSKRPKTATVAGAGGTSVS